MQAERRRPVRARDYDTDLYPPQTGRRRFVKGVIGGAVLTETGAAGSSVVQLSTAPSGGVLEAVCETFVG
jgi:hypothetical protein